MTSVLARGGPVPIRSSHRVQFAPPEAATLNPDRGVHREGHIFFFFITLKPRVGVIQKSMSLKYEGHVACTMLRLMCALDPESLNPEPRDTGVPRS